MAPAPCEDAMKVVEMTPKDLEYYVNVIHKAASGFERTDFSLLSNHIASYREIVQDRKRNDTKRFRILCKLSS